MTAPAVKTTTLRPIVHKDAYTARIARDLDVWLDEAIIAPLLIVLARHEIPVDAKYHAIRFDEFGRENATSLTPYPASWGSLNVPRGEMPQIPAESRGALVQFLDARGIGHYEVEQPVTALRPTQGGYHEDKVLEYTLSDRAILVGRDGYILDGHHQWTALRLKDESASIRTIVFDAGIWSLLKHARLLPSSERTNATTSALEAALNRGQVHYADGVFSGKFSAAISRELRELGATFNSANSIWRISQENIPLELRGTLATSASRASAASSDVLSTLTQMQANIAIAPVGIDYAPAVDAIVSDLGRQFIATTGAVSRKTIGITPEIDAGMRATLNAALTENLDLAIKNFASERIPEMRRRVEENVFQFGARSDRLAKILEAEFGICKRKAEFLADQETGLLTAKYREARYAEIGIDAYIWETSKDRRVRESHRLLQGKKCTFEHGANVSDPGEPARYLNPGEDWRCRCVPRPVVNIEKLLREAA